MKKGSKSILKNKKCYGCAVCVDVCPSNAIELKLDKNGFLQPVVNTELCLDCGVCCRFCIGREEKGKKEIDLKKTRMYAGWSLDEELRKESASGGVFSQIAVSFLKRELYGVVFAAGHFEGSVLCHEMFLDCKKAWRWQNTKYVQSNMSGVYANVYEKLKEGFSVLFSGTPCQVYALNMFLKGKAYKGILYTIDIVCHGVPSYKLVEMSSLLSGCQVSKFRIKENGWGHEAKRIVYENGMVAQKHSEDVFYLMFESDRFLRKECYACPFSEIPRVGDLSVGDYWGNLSFLKDDEIKKGVSLVLENTSKGEQLLKMTNGMQLINSASLQDVLFNNPNVFTNSVELAGVSDSDKLWLVKYWDCRIVRNFLVFGKFGSFSLKSKKKERLKNQKKERVKQLVSDIIS